MTLIDAHVHIWDPTVLTYEWLVGTAVDRPMLPREWAGAANESTSAVFVQAADGATDPVDEARWVAGLDWPELIAIVAAADLTQPAARVGAQLDALTKVPGVAGVRHLLQDTPAERFADIAEGLHLLQSRGGTFDACIRHHQLPALTELLRPVPELVVVVDHLAKPPIDEGIRSDAGRAWARALSELAARPATFVKLSGLTAESRNPRAFDRNADAFLVHTLDAFGPERTMVGSDWPVSSEFGVGGSPDAWVDRVRALVPGEDWPAVAADAALSAYLPGGVPRLSRSPR